MRGGVPVLKRRMESPSVRRQPVSSCALRIPSGPDAIRHDPVMTLLSR